MEKENVIDNIKNIINELRPFLINDGGDVEFVKYEDNTVYIKVAGACSHCHLLDFTLKDLIERAIIEEIPEVKKVVNLDD